MLERQTDQIEILVPLKAWGFKSPSRYMPRTMLSCGSGRFLFIYVKINKR
ncbi:MAG: hypothetical protein UX15_C0033G0004 [Parcubacteria group bacterium GW2011_GWA1_45_7]|nr:MAG: hypothetical protein UX15_C0033G0004 [Parcubacteria group bacterium GW2011_GWA1_45_7]